MALETVRERLVGAADLPLRPLAVRDLLAQRLVQRLREQVEDPVVLPEADREGDRHERARDDDARAQLVEVLDDREVLVVVNGSNRAAHPFHPTLQAFKTRRLQVDYSTQWSAPMTAAQRATAGAAAKPRGNSRAARAPRRSGARPRPERLRHVRLEVRPADRLVARRARALARHPPLPQLRLGGHRRLRAGDRRPLRP